MNYTINELKHRVLEKVYATYEVFKNFYGERFTDLQGVPDDEEFIMFLQYSNIKVEDNSVTISEEVLQELINDFGNGFGNSRRFDIIIWWPNVRVTNENDKSVLIQDLYAKVQIKKDGTIPYEVRGFQLIRSTFTAEQWTCGYVHSHVPMLHGLPRWEDPCLGTGPIRNTILSLHNSWDEMMWMLFCQELALYVTVESLIGGPYLRLESIGSRSVDYTFRLNSPNLYTNRLYETYKDFIEYYLRNGHVSFLFQDGKFGLGLSYLNFILDISNCFIAWYNEGHVSRTLEDLYGTGTLRKAILSGGSIYRSTYDRETDTTVNGRPCGFTFKGNEVVLRIQNGGESEANEVILLNPELAEVILNRILRTVNYHYTNEYSTKQTSTTPSASGKTVYL